MSAQHPLSEEWDQKLQSVFEAADRYLEEKFGTRWTRRPNRPEEGQTVNPQMSGLFNIGASFTAGYGSQYGRGYVLDFEICTYDTVDPQERLEIEQEAVTYLKEKLCEVFPERKLEIVHDGPVYKIVGDFFLGEAYT